MTMRLFVLVALSLVHASSAIADDGRLPAPTAGDAPPAAAPDAAPDDFVDPDDAQPTPPAADPEDGPAAAPRERATVDDDRPRRRRRKVRKKRRQRGTGFVEQSFFDRHLTFSLDPNLIEEVEEELTLTWIASAAMTYPVGAFGLIWGPLVFTSAGYPGSDWLIDAIVHYLLFSMVNGCVTFVCLPAGIANIWYFGSIQFLNLYSYHVKKARAEGKLDLPERRYRAQVAHRSMAQAY